LIAQGVQTDRAVLDLVAPALKRAADDNGAAFFLSRLRGRDVEIVHVETPETGVSFLHPGLGKRPLHACSCSKAVAAFAPELVGLQALEGRLKAYTEFTLTRIEDLEADLDAVRRRGYAECVEEIERGMASVAATLSESGPGATLSIGATGSTRVFTAAFRADLGPRLVALARDLSRELALPGPSVGLKSA
jgi:DNA-binding IclR family transcriptional regulator